MNKRTAIHPSHMDHLVLMVGRAVICFGIGVVWALVLWGVA